MTVLVTGAAGFVGSHLSRALLEAGRNVIGVDNLNDYYDPALKRGRLETLAPFDRFRFHQVDLAEPGALETFVSRDEITHIVHLAAQAGVRYSLDNPHAYARSNLNGHLNMLEFARYCPNLKHMAYASSSSVYGEQAEGPYREDWPCMDPVSLYAATKRSGELMSRTYSRLYGLPLTGLRFFTVYGPWGRPDMAYWIFTEKILSGEPITLFAPDEMSRDFTYIGDVVSALVRLVDLPPTKDGGGKDIPHIIYNIGNSKPTPLMDLVRAVEQACGREAEKIIGEKQAGDVSRTFADISRASADFGYDPSTTIWEGIPTFVDWYRGYFGV